MNRYLKDKKIIILITWGLLISTGNLYSYALLRPYPLRRRGAPDEGNLISRSIDPSLFRILPKQSSKTFRSPGFVGSWGVGGVGGIASGGMN